MLFILVMDVLNLLIQRASLERLLQPMSSRSLQHRISLYVDDVVMFLKHVASNVNLVLDIIRLFGHASGLRINVQKSSVYPIRCGDEDLNCAQNQSLALSRYFHATCKYLGLPLSVRKLSRVHFQAILDQVWLVFYHVGRQS